MRHSDRCSISDSKLHSTQRRNHHEKFLTHSVETDGISCNIKLTSECHCWGSDTPRMQSTIVDYQPRIHKCKAKVQTLCMQVKKQMSKE